MLHLQSFRNWKFWAWAASAANIGPFAIEQRILHTFYWYITFLDFCFRPILQRGSRYGGHRHNQRSQSLNRGQVLSRAEVGGMWWQQGTSGKVKLKTEILQYVRSNTKYQWKCGAFGFSQEGRRVVQVAPWAINSVVRVHQLYVRAIVTKTRHGRHLVDETAISWGKYIWFSNYANKKKWYTHTEIARRNIKFHKQILHTCSHESPAIIACDYIDKHIQQNSLTTHALYVIPWSMQRDSQLGHSTT